MPSDIIQLEECNQLVRAFEEVIEVPLRHKTETYYTGVDLGTSYVMLAVLDDQYRPVAGMVQFADVVRDGMIVDYIGAVHIVESMKKNLEEKLQKELVYASAALPPGTNLLDGGAIRNVVESAGFILSNLSDEPTAANEVLKIRDGVVVDIGGGTTGISIFENGKLMAVSDEPTGGTHFSLVLSGAYKIPFEEAEKMKLDPGMHRKILPVLIPTIEKVATIISNATRNFKVDQIVLVGGTACLAGIDTIIQAKTGIFTTKPANPMFVTPLGIALQCKAKELVT